MKTAVIIHGLPEKEEFYSLTRPASSNCHWLPWIQKQLLLKDILAQTPEMPVAYNPEYNAWKEMLERFPLDEETILIGHSCGGGFIVRYLSENNVKVGKVVLVAPWIDPDKFLKTGMFDFNIDENIVSKTKGVTIFSSTDDMQEVQDSIKTLKEKIKGIKVVEFEKKGHFSYSDIGLEFPELLTEAIS
ncbi:MAG: alpha/beta hydrolase [Candidatus Nomurabacteria bacterium]|nr:alpha/beta hydrolase [Candidatus Nomurabacteria bacterium]